MSLKKRIAKIELARFVERQNHDLEELHIYWDGGRYYVGSVWLPKILTLRSGSKGS
jgi:hypothetical protein